VPTVLEVTEQLFASVTVTLYVPEAAGRAFEMAGY
jgi:hypothetical protein